MPGKQGGESVESVLRKKAFISVYAMNAVSWSDALLGECRESREVKCTCLDEDLGVESVHERERQVVVQYAGDDLQRRVGGVLGITDIGWHDATSADTTRCQTRHDSRHDATSTGHEMMPADDRHDPQRRHRPDLTSRQYNYR